MMPVRTTVVTLALLTLGALSAEAQVRQYSFQVALQGGWQTYASGSALEGGPTVGADATFYISSALGIGLWTDFSLTESDGEKFPPAALDFVDSTTFTIVSQPVNIWQYGGHAKLQLPARRVAPFVLVGAGGYTLFFDPQQTNGNNNVTGFVARFGVGVDFAISEGAGFQIAVSDAFYPSWKPNRLFPVSEENQNTRFPELNPDPGELEGSVHNFKFMAGVILVPGGL